MKKSPRERVLERALEMAAKYAYEKIDCPDCPCDCDGMRYGRGYCTSNLKAHFIRKATKEAKGEL